MYEIKTHGTHLRVIFLRRKNSIVCKRLQCKNFFHFLKWKYNDDGCAWCVCVCAGHKFFSLSLARCKLQFIKNSSHSVYIFFFVSLSLHILHSNDEWDCEWVKKLIALLHVQRHYHHSSLFSDEFARRKLCSWMQKVVENNEKCRSNLCHHQIRES